MPASQGFITLGDLPRGIELRTQAGGSAILVGKTWRQGDFEVFDVEVAGLHRFYVRGPGVDAPAVLVHNSSSPSGVVYKRVDAGGGEKPYVGQAKSEKHYQKRQRKHARSNPDADFEFEILERAEPGKALDVAEEGHIRALDGPTNKSNPSGGTSNKRHQMNEKRYEEAGGSVPKDQ